MKEALVVGIGNTDRGDDGAGPTVCRLLLELGNAAAADVIVDAGDPARLFEKFSGRSLVILCDAVNSGAPVGAVHEFAAHARELPADLHSVSTHGLHPGQLVELARALGVLPPRIFVFGIEAGDFSLGAPLSAPVAQACRFVADRILRLLGQERVGASPKPTPSVGTEATHA